MNTELEYINCKCCGGEEYTEVFKARENQFNIRDEFSVVKCKKCDLVFTNPRPLEENIGRYYPKESYYTHISVEETYKQNKKRWSIKHKVLEIIYYEAGNGVKVPVLVKAKNKVTGLIFKRFIAILVPYKKGGKLLDVGCGNGIFLNLMKQNGWETHGVDISESCVIEARKAGIDVFKGRLEEAKFNNKQFDVVVANQVLEHVHDPIKFLIECKRILKDDGLLVIGVPNFGSYDSKMYKENWTALQVPTHLYHFTPKTLGNVLNKAGFKVGNKYQSLLMQYNKQYIKNNIHNVINETGSVNSQYNKNRLINIFSILFKIFLIKPFLFLFNLQRGPLFAVNITAYATKDNYNG